MIAVVAIVVAIDVVLPHMKYAILKTGQSKMQVEQILGELPGYTVGNGPHPLSQIAWYPGARVVVSYDNKGRAMEIVKK